VNTGKALRARFLGDSELAATLSDGGLELDEQATDLVLDASSAQHADWPALEGELTRAFELCRAARRAAGTVVVVVAEPALYGHSPPLEAMLATGLLGAIRTYALEGQRDGVRACAVSVDPGAEPERVAGAILVLLGDRHLSGTIVNCGTAHLGRPPA
jgi:hypothetical protein